MRLLSPKYTLAIIGIAALGCMLFGGKSVRAESANYEFTARPGDSLSVISRRAVQLVDEKDTSFKLNQPQAMYVETNYVQKQGSPLLEVGQKVSIDSAQLTALCKEAAKLSAEEQSRWKLYSDLAVFDLTALNPTSGATASTTTGSNTSANPSSSPTPASSTTPSPTASTDTKNVSTTKKSSQWYWWLIGLVVLGGLWYLLGGKSKEKE